MLQYLANFWFSIGICAVGVIFIVENGQILKKTICPSGHTELCSAFRHRQKLNVVIKRLGIFFLITDVGDDENKHNMEKFIYGHVDNSFKIIRQIIESVSVVPSRLVCVCVRRVGTLKHVHRCMDLWTERDVRLVHVIQGDRNKMSVQVNE